MSIELCILMMLFMDSPRSDLSDPLPTGDKSSALKRAEEIQANLSAKYPSFVKLMLKSHVSGGFWLVSQQKTCTT